MDPSQKVLVTGADGFIGSHLVESLVMSGYSVRAFCLYNSFGSYGWLDTLENSIKSEIEFFLGDIRDPTIVKKAVKGTSTVFHLAALIAIPYSYSAPSSYVNTNVLGTLNILEASIESNLSRVIHTSTSETYGTAQYVPINESHPLVAQSPYAATKIAADQLAISYYHSFNLPVTILRPFNTYGPRQSARAVIPTIITQIANGEQTVKLGSLHPTRDFNYVLDTCSAFVSVAQSKKTFGKVINSSSNFEISIESTAEMIAEVMNSSIPIELQNERIRPNLSEVDRLFGDNSLLTSLTDWTPKFSGLDGFKRGLRITAEWFSDPANLALYNSKDYII